MAAAAVAKEGSSETRRPPPLISNSHVASPWLGVTFPAAYICGGGLGEIRSLSKSRAEKLLYAGEEAFLVEFSLPIPLLLGSLPTWKGRGGKKKSDSWLFPLSRTKGARVRRSQ